MKDIEERLHQVDMEIHRILHDLRSRRKTQGSIEDVAARMDKEMVSAEDTTRMIRSMRDRDPDT